MYAAYTANKTCCLRRKMTPGTSRLVSARFRFRIFSRWTLLCSEMHVWAWNSIIAGTVFATGPLGFPSLGSDSEEGGGGGWWAPVPPQDLQQVMCGVWCWNDSWSSSFGGGWKTTRTLVGKSYSFVYLVGGAYSMIDISFTNRLKPPVSDELPLDVFFSHLDDVIFFCTFSKRARAALDASAHVLCFCQGLKMCLTFFTVSFTRFLCVCVCICVNMTVQRRRSADAVLTDGWCRCIDQMQQ